MKMTVKVMMTCVCVCADRAKCVFVFENQALVLPPFALCLLAKPLFDEDVAIKSCQF